MNSCGVSPTSSESDFLSTCLPQLREIANEAVEGILDRMYAKLLNDPVSAAFFKDECSIKRAREGQRTYFLSLFEEASAESRRDALNGMIRAHQRLGIGVEWFLSAYEFYIEELTQAAAGRDGQFSPGIARTLNHVAFRDLHQISSHYSACDAEERARIAERRSIEVEAVAALATAAVSDDGVSSGMDAFAERLRLLVEFDRISIAIYDESKETLPVRYSRPPLPNFPDGCESAAPLESLREKFPDSKPKLIDADALKKLACRFPLAGALAEFGVKSSIYTPLKRDGHILGLFGIQSRSIDAYSDDDLRLMERICQQIAGTMALLDEREQKKRLISKHETLEETHNTRSEFLGSIAHEIKTPLTSVIAFSELLGRDPEKSLTPRQAQQVDAIRRNGRQMEMLVSDLVELSRDESGEFNLNLSEVDMSDVLRKAVADFGPSLESRGQMALVETPANPLICLVDSSRIGQVIGNLISNSSKYSDKGTTIEVSLQSHDGAIDLVVKDYGFGIDQKSQERLFEKFYRGDDPRSRAMPGTGIGLHVAKLIVDAHSGQISIKSEPGEGTTVQLTIPRRVELRSE